MSRWPTDAANNPLVSILCHCYQHAEYVRDALNGFLSQITDFPFEIIVHDDASSDRTAEIVREYEELYPNVIRSILQDENQFSRGRRPPSFTFPAARGRYIALCEGDDYWMDSEKLDKQVACLENNPSLVACGHDAFTVRDGVIEQVSKLPASLKRDLSATELQRGPMVLTLTACFRNVLDGLPVEHQYVLNGDKFIFSRLGQYGSFSYLPEIMPAAYRIHDAGVWSLLDERNRRLSSLNSLYWIGQYYRRTGNEKLADEFAEQHVKQGLREIQSWSLARVARLTRSQLDLWLRWKWPRVHRLVTRLNLFRKR